MPMRTRRLCLETTATHSVFSRHKSVTKGSSKPPMTSFFAKFGLTPSSSPVGQFRPSKIRVAAILVLATVFVLDSPALARRSALEDLTAALLRHDSYKVRLQAAVVLGRRKDPRAIGALSQCLRFESHRLVRAMCAAALGKLGDLRAKPALIAAKKDRDAFVRKMAVRALAKLSDFVLPTGHRNWKRPPRRKARSLVLLGTMNSGRRRVNKAYRDHMRRTFWRLLAKHARLDLAQAADKPPASYLTKYHLKGYRLDASLVRLKSRTKRGLTKVRAKVRISLSEYPRSKIVMMTSGRATASQHFAGGKPDRRLYHQLKLRAIEGAVQMAAQNIWTYLKRR